MPRLDRGIQYAAAYRFNNSGLWNTGSPAFAGDDKGEAAKAELSPHQLQPFVFGQHLHAVLLRFREL
jgi:hypothetical protein